jgi:hypothetical protein
MGIPSRPRFQAQNPAISGYSLGWLSCTAYSMAMLIDRSTLGAKHPSGKDVRIGTGDTTDGLTLPQAARVADTEYGVHVEVHVGGSTATPAYALAQLRAGRGMSLQGNTSALIRTPYRSTGGPVNHNVYVNEVRSDGDALVYDPAADGRRTYDQGPSWWPWATVLRFAAALRPWGDNDPRILGPGRMYAGFGPDTEPHVHLRSGARRSTPFPDRTRAWASNAKRRVNVRSRPDIKAPIVDTLAVGELWVAYQTVQGSVVDGDRTWMGNHDGTEWVHRGGLRHIGGTT